jgi:hypothetical protein
MYFVGLLVSAAARRFTVTPPEPAVTVRDIPFAPAPSEVAPAFATTPEKLTVEDVTALNV